MFHAMSSFVLLLLVAGIACRRRRRIHIPLMIAAFGLDFASVLAIELTRRAIHKVTTAPSPLLLFHVTVSVLALVFYGVMFRLGQRVQNGDEGVRPWHRRFAWMFGACRATNYVTSWVL
jgi:uncharacterized membrane protein